MSHPLLRYVYCTKCFSEIQGDTITIGDDSNNFKYAFVYVQNCRYLPFSGMYSKIEKTLFVEMKNNAIEMEP